MWSSGQLEVEEEKARNWAKTGVNNGCGIRNLGFSIHTLSAQLITNSTSRRGQAGVSLRSNSLTGPARRRGGGFAGPARIVVYSRYTMQFCS